MAMITETIYAGRDNTFSLQLVRGGEPINLLAITGYELVLDEESGLIFKDLNLTSGIFLEKPNGIVEISVGENISEDQTGRYQAYLITYDPINIHGVVWPKFILKVK